MTIRETIQKIENGCFGPEHLSAVKTAYRAAVERWEFSTTEKDYEEGKQTLESRLTEPQRSLLAESGRNCEVNWTYAVKYGFSAGMFAGFQRYFASSEKANCTMEQLLEKSLFEAPGMERHREYHDRTIRCLEISEELEKALTEDLREHLISVDCAWSERIHFSATHEFYLGFRVAMNIIETVMPATEQRLIPDTLMLEYHLGMIDSVDRMEGRRRT